MRHSALASRSLATWPSQMQTQEGQGQEQGEGQGEGANTGYEPKEFDKITSVDSDTMLINDPDHNTSDTSKTMNENTGQFGILTVFESSVVHVCHW